MFIYYVWFEKTTIWSFIQAEQKNTEGTLDQDVDHLKLVWVKFKYSEYVRLTLWNWV